jgi:D-methionine transport system ATP-binding protein
MPEKERIVTAEPFVRIRGLQKTFRTRDGDVEVLKGIDLDVERGDIFGVIGFSGAGKSTLLRCLNRLESLDSGEVTINGVKISSLDKRRLLEERRKIGIIFQQFNLFDSGTVFDNVAFPLEIADVPRQRIKERVEEILELVELSDKRRCHPAQLSGGQKQRVGIARALANEPELLLSDEATSALDPQTTYSILELLKEINQRLGLTVILVTHELDVVKCACRHMAVIEDGRIVEKGDVRSVFMSPKSETARQFIRIGEEFVREFTVDGGDSI